MKYLKFNKKQKRDAREMHRKCYIADQKKMHAKQHVDRVENGVYRVGR